jgi:hypothetical protein
MKRRGWTKQHIRTLKSLARKRMPAVEIARKLKRTEGATRQKAFSLWLSLETRAGKILTPKIVGEGVRLF